MRWDEKCCEVWTLSMAGVSASARKGPQSLATSAPQFSQSWSRMKEIFLASPVHTLSCLPWLLAKRLPFWTQAQFGRNGNRCPRDFCLFHSETKNLLFNDNTECLAKLHGKTTYTKYLGQQYVTATSTLEKCSTSREWTLGSLTEKIVGEGQGSGSNCL